MGPSGRGWLLLGMTPMILLIVCLHLPGSAARCVPRTEEVQLEPLPAGVDPNLQPAGILQPQIRQQGQGVGTDSGTYGGTYSGSQGRPEPGSYKQDGPGLYGGTGSYGGPGSSSYGTDGLRVYGGTISNGGPGPGSYGIDGPIVYGGTGSNVGPGPGSYGIDGPGAYGGTGTGSSGVSGPGSNGGTGGGRCDTSEGAMTGSYEQPGAGSYGIQGPGAHEGARPDVSMGGSPSQYGRPGVGYGIGLGRPGGHLRPSYRNPSIPVVPGLYDEARTAGHIRVNLRDPVSYFGNYGMRAGMEGFQRPKYKDPSIPYMPSLSELPNHAKKEVPSVSVVSISSTDGGGVGTGDEAIQGSSNPGLPNNP